MSEPRNESDTFEIGGDLTVHRLGFGGMRITGEDILGEPDDPETARALLKHAVEIGVDVAPVVGDDAVEESGGALSVEDEDDRTLHSAFEADLDPDERRTVVETIRDIADRDEVGARDLDGRLGVTELCERPGSAAGPLVREFVERAERLDVDAHDQWATASSIASSTFGFWNGFVI